jgi:hypothetical protein
MWPMLSWLLSNCRIMILRAVKHVAALLTLLALSAGCSKPATPVSMPPPTRIPPQPERLFYRISVEGKWGFIDATGRVVIEPQFLEATNFSEGLARVSVAGLTEEDRIFEKNASGFINEAGEFVIGPGSPPDYELPEFGGGYSYGDFHDGLAKFWIGDAGGIGGYIDRTGKLVIPPQFAGADDFSEGLACVSLPRNDGSSFGPKQTVFIDRNGKVVIEPKRSFIATGFSEGLCVIDIQSRGDWQPSVIDQNGDAVVRPGVYTGISPFIGGLARVVKNGQVGCIDRQGKLVIPANFDQLYEFDQGDLTTAVKGGKKFIVDRTGRCVAEISLGSGFNVGRLRGGLASVTFQNKVGYIDTWGELVIPLRFDSGEDFRGELALVEMAETSGYIDKQGEFVWKTDRWDEPIRNAVKKPLSDFLPPETVKALPLEYNWQHVENAIVFASNVRFDSLRPWLTRTFGSRFKLRHADDEHGVININFYGDEILGSFHAVDVKSEALEGFIGFYASKNMKLLLEEHRPAAVGILILDR